MSNYFDILTVEAVLVQYIKLTLSAIETATETTSWILFVKSEL